MSSESLTVLVKYTSFCEMLCVSVQFSFYTGTSTFNTYAQRAMHPSTGPNEPETNLMNLTETQLWGAERLPAANLAKQREFITLRCSLLYFLWDLAEITILFSAAHLPNIMSTIFKCT